MTSFCRYAEDVNAALALKLDISYTVSEMEEGVFKL